MDIGPAFAERNLPVVVSTDENYLPYVKVLINSIVACTRSSSLDILVLHAGMDRQRLDAVMDRVFYHYCENGASVTHTQAGLRRVESFARVGEILRKAMPEPEYADFHDRVTRDALLLWIRHRVFDRTPWRELRFRTRGGQLADPRHGLFKKGALVCAACLFD